VLSRCLVLGASHAEVPIISLAQGMGYEVVCLSADANGAGRTLADVFVHGDYSDRRLAERVARSFAVGGVIAGANDFAAISAAWTAAALGLPGHDSYTTSKALHHKHRFRAMALKFGLPVAEHIVLQPEESPSLTLPFGFPVLVKPVDLTGGKGISLVEKPRDLSDAVVRAREQSRRGDVLIERFISGTNHGLSFLIRQERVVWAFSDDEFYTCNDFLVAGTSFPSSLKQDHLDALRAGIERLASSKRLVDGIFHMQVIQSANCVVIVDVMRRCAGDLYPTFVELSTRFPYLLTYVSPAPGLGLPEVNPSEAFYPTARHCVIAERAGTVLSLPEIRSTRHRKQRGREILIPPGHVVKRGGVDKTEISFFQYSSAAEMRNDTRRLAKLIQPEVR